MTSPWSRPADGDNEPPQGVVEIELDGPGIAVSQTAPRRSGHGPAPDQPNWRKVIAISSVVGVALGLVVAAVVLTDDGDDPDRDEPVDPADITTPDTLPQVAFETIAPDTTVPSAVSPLQLATFPDANMPADILDNFVLDPEALPAVPPPRVRIDTTSDDALGAMSITAEFDAATDRYLVTFDEGGPVVRMLVDVESGTIYFNDTVRDGGPWRVYVGPESARASARFYESVMLTPVRADTVPSAAITAETGVVLDNGTIARRYIVTLPAVAIPELTSGNEPPAPGVDHVFEAFVDEQGRLALVQGTVVVDGIRRLVEIRPDHQAEVSIGIPTDTVPFADSFPPDPP